MALTQPQFDRRRAKLRNNVDGASHFLHAEPPPGQYFLITHRVEISESFGEFNLFAIHCDRTISGLFAPHVFGQVARIHREEPAYLRAAEFQLPGSAGGLAQVYDAPTRWAKHVTEHVKKMYADIRRHPA